MLIENPAKQSAARPATPKRLDRSGSRAAARPRDRPVRPVAMLDQTTQSVGLGQRLARALIESCTADQIVHIGDGMLPACGDDALGGRGRQVTEVGSGDGHNPYTEWPWSPGRHAWV